MSGFENDVLVAKNLNFNEAAAKPHLGILNASGLLPIGTGNTSPTPEILAGRLTSPLGTLSIGYASPNITLDITGGQVAVEHLTGDTGGQLNPDGSNNFNLLGQQAGTIAVMDTIGTVSTIRFENRTWATAFVVDPSSTVGLRGTFQTIQAAITAASSPTDIFIRPGTYTENLTMKAGVNLIGFKGDSMTPQVTIIGTVGASYTGTASISNVRLQTNSANFLSLTGANATAINLLNCDLNATNADGIGSTGSNSSASVKILNCTGDVGTTGIKMFAFTNGGLNIEYSKWTNTGGTTTLSTQSGGGLSTRYSTFSSGMATSGSTATIGIRYTVIDTNDFPQTCISHASTSAALCQIYDCYLSSGSSSAVSVGAGAQTEFVDNIVKSSNTNAITGSGAIVDANTIFDGTSLTNNVTTLTKRASSGISFDAVSTLSTYTTTTWVPVLNFGGATTGIAYTTQLGNYTRIGNIVFLQAYIVLSSKGSATGTATITGAPFNAITQAGLQQSLAMTVKGNLTVTNFAGLFGLMTSNSATITVDAWTTTGGVTTLQDTHFANNTSFIVEGYYIAN